MTLRDENETSIFGYMKNDRKACVAVTGCYGQENLEFTIHSKHTGHKNMFIMDKYGNVKEIKRSFEVDFCKNC